MEDGISETRAMKELIKQLRSENDNLVIDLQLQAGHEQGMCSSNDNTVVDVDHDKIKSVVDELIKTKKENTEMILYLNVLADKINVTENVKSSKMEGQNR